MKTICQACSYLPGVRLLVPACTQELLSFVTLWSGLQVPTACHQLLLPIAHLEALLLKEMHPNVVLCKRAPNMAQVCHLQLGNSKGCEMMCKSDACSIHQWAHLECHGHYHRDICSIFSPVADNCLPQLKACCDSQVLLHVGLQHHGDAQLPN